MRRRPGLAFADADDGDFVFDAARDDGLLVARHGRPEDLSASLDALALEDWRRLWGLEMIRQAALAVVIMSKSELEAALREESLAPAVRRRALTDTATDGERVRVSRLLKRRERLLASG